LHCYDIPAGAAVERILGMARINANEGAISFTGGLQSEKKTYPQAAMARRICSLAGGFACGGFISYK
jgi:hypothetical protein